MVEHNWHRDDPAFVADPALGNGELFREVLAGAGIAVAGAARSGTDPSGSIELARLRSPTVAELVTTMLLESDNEVAELLTREAGVAVAHEGSTEAGTAALAAGLAGLCLELGPGWADGSGMSRTDLRSARELRTLLHAAPSAPGWPVVQAGLPLGGRTGTLAGRFVGTPAEANVRAKTGYILDGRSLSGMLTTAGGRQVVFSMLVNGPGAAASVDAIDELIVALASDRS
jgi:D-alanyl-D-alanine carboxypeptidase/D-alanyl-D-alanine-endopeptidase (penicillin-binding protein 4)